MKIGTLHRTLLTACTFGVAAACSLAVDADRTQCSKNADCLGRGGLSSKAICVAKVCTEPLATVVEEDAGADADAAPVDKTWGCLGNLPELPVEEPDVPVERYLRFSSIISTKPLVGLPVKACLVTDETCAQPYAGTPKETDAAGLLSVTLYSGFRGYFDITPAGDYANLMPAIYYVLPIPDKNYAVTADRSPSIALFTKNELEFAVASVGKALKEEYGHLIFGIMDCSPGLVADVVVRAEPISNQTFTFYTDGTGVPSITQSKTSQNGNGGFVNLPAGKVKMRATLESGRFVGERELLIRPGTITYLIFGPTKEP
ncbi:MAG TPA: hypothetical protein VM925_23910 [Labilithrix sp.]|nr:hypothetical protein [Labilithrix sp.]